MTIKKKEQVTIKVTNKKWIKSVIVRGVGIAFGIFFGVSCVFLDGNKWLDSIIMVLLLLASYWMVIIIPDKIIFGKYLKKKKTRKLK